MSNIKNILKNTVFSACIVMASAWTTSATDLRDADSTPYDWSGLFLGGSIGGAWNPTSYTHVETLGVGGPAVNNEAFSTKGSSFSGGVHIGYQHQFDTIVVGVEGGYTLFNATDSERTDLNGIPRTRETELEDLWHVEAKLGYAFDRVLPYVKVGYANTKLNYINTRIADGVVVGSSSERVDGYVLGAGVDFALAENWILGAEYTFSSFNVGNQQQTRGGAPVAAFNSGNDVDLHNVGLKLSYKF